MNDALSLFGIAASLSALGFIVWVVGRIWIRSKEIDREEVASLAAGSAADIAGSLAQIEARLSRLEQSVDSTAIEVERISEAQRFAARMLPRGAPDSPR